MRSDVAGLAGYTLDTLVSAPRRRLLALPPMPTQPAGALLLAMMASMAWCYADDTAAAPPRHVTVTPACTDSTTSALLFCDSDLPRDARACDLIGRMNLTEKISLLNAGRVWVERLGVHTLEGNECLHGLLNRGQNIPISSNASQVEPYVIDGAATIFPQSIGMGATWNRTLLRAMGDVISTEAVAKRNQHRKQGGDEPGRSTSAGTKFLV